MTTLPERNCANCRDWHNTGGNEGECRRRSPTPMTYPATPTTADYWCGDFRRIRRIAAIGRPPLLSDESILEEVRKAEAEKYDVTRNWVVNMLEPKGFAPSTVYKRIKAMLASGVLAEELHPTLGQALRISKEPVKREANEPVALGRGRIHSWDTLGASITSIVQDGAVSASKVRRLLKEHIGRDVGHDTIIRVMNEGVDAKAILKTGSLYRAITNSGSGKA